MRHRNSNTPTTTVAHPFLLGSYPFVSETSVENALYQLFEYSDFREASEHVVTLMELLCSELPYSDYTDDLKQELWFKSRTLRSFLNAMADAKANANVISSISKV
jgi:hypothetical protein